MSGVGITGKIKPKDGGVFPVFEDIDGQGGLRCVQTIADRNTFSAAPAYCKKGMQCYVADLQVVYELGADLVTWVFFAPSPSLAAQSDWYVDSAGSANNDGKLGNPIPFDELTRRLCPNGSRCMLSRDVVAHVAFGSQFGYEYFGVGSADGGVHTFTIACEIHSSAPFTLTGVVQPDPSIEQRGELTTGTGTFTHYQRVRLVSGASAGAIAYSTGLHANAQNSYVSGFITPTTAGFHVPTPAAVGDTAVTDTLGVLFGRLELDCGPGGLIVVEDAQLVRGVANGVSVNTPSSEGGGNVTFAGCEAVGLGSAWDCHAGGANLFACVVVGSAGPFGVGTTTFTGEGWLGWGNICNGRMGTGQGSFLSYGLCIDGGQLVIGVNPFFNPNSSGSPSRFAAYQGYNGAGAIEVENGPCAFAPTAPAIWICPGSALQNGIPIAWQWGASGAYAVGYLISAGAWIYCENVVPASYLAFLKIPSTVNIRMAGLDFAYSDNPIVLGNYNCGITAADFAISGSLTDGGFYLQNQNASVAPTDFANIVTVGMYKVSGYLATTTADAGSADVPVLNIIYTDDSGVARTKAVVTGHALTTLGGEGAEVIIESGAGAKLQWSITGVSSPGAAKFSTRCRVEYVAFGP